MLKKSNIENYSFFVIIAYHKPGHKHWLEQTGHREEAASGGQPQSVSVSVRKAWTGTAAQEAMPVRKEKA